MAQIITMCDHSPRARHPGMWSQVGLESTATNKASSWNELEGIPAELFQILKDDAVKVLHSIRQQIWKTQQWPQDWKRSVFIPIPKKGNAKVYSNYCTIALISHASKIMLKILQARLRQYVTRELHSPHIQTVDSNKCTVMPQRWSRQRHTMWFYLCLNQWNKIFTAMYKRF